MPEMHLRKPRFVYSACGLFTRHKERIKEFKHTGDTHYIYRSELDKACFQHDSANSFVTRTKFSADTNALDDKIDGVEKKIPDISGLATKTSLNSYLQTSTFNSNVTEVENEIKDADIIAESAVTKANTIKSDLTAYAKNAEVATDIATMKK